jgi:hypothetical protein
MKKPNVNRDKVLWHLNCSTNLNPKFLEAIKLKEQMNGEVLAQSDNSSIRSFVRRRVIADRDIVPERQPRSTPIERKEFEATTRPAASEVSTPAVPATQPSNGTEVRLTAPIPMPAEGSANLLGEVPMTVPTTLPTLQTSSSEEAKSDEPLVTILPDEPEAR